MLRRDVVPPRHLRHDRARRIGLRHDPALGFIAPATPPPRSDLDIDPAPRSRSFNHMVDHRCDSTSRMWAASCRAARALQGGGGEPLTHNSTPGSAENGRNQKNSLLFSLFFDARLLAYSPTSPPSATTTARIASW